MNDSTTFKPGDRVRINRWRNYRLGKILAVSGNVAIVIERDGEQYCHHVTDLTPCPRMSQPARTLLAAWHASDRTLHKLNETTTGGGRIRHRWYTTDDGIVTLRITTGSES